MSDESVRNRQRGWWWRNLSGLPWLLMTAYPVGEMLVHRPPPLLFAVSLAAAAVFILNYLWLFLRTSDDDGPSRTIGVVNLVVLAGLMPLALGPTWLPMLFYVPFPVALMGRGRIAIALLAINALMSLLIGLGTGISPVSATAFTLELGMMSLAGLGVRRLMTTVIELRDARAELARLAVTEERERFARDLHDLLGHSLSVIALKSELAGRLIGTDPERAAREVSEIEAVTRQSLKEVREAVSGMRETNLLSEIASARATLEAAGISCRMESPSPQLPPMAETLFAWAVREGATNVLRHSRARTCRIRVVREGQNARMEVIDDGPRSAAGDNGLGNGLRGLAERVAACNGELQAGLLKDGGFRLAVSLPVGRA